MKNRTTGKLIVAAFAFILVGGSPHSEAAEGSGIRGGDVIYCEVGSATTVDLLDYHESSVNPRTVPNLAGATWEEKVEDFLSRVRKVDRFIGGRLDRYWSEWSDEALVTSRIQIPEISDASIAYSVKNCHVRQAAYQRTAAKTLEIRYLIDQGIWEQLDPMRKAGLVIHEMLYRLAAYHYGAENSDGLRYYNGIMSSAAASSLTPDRYLDVSSDAGLFMRQDCEAYTHILDNKSQYEKTCSGRGEMMVTIDDGVYRLYRGQIAYDRAKGLLEVRTVAFRDFMNALDPITDARPRFLCQNGIALRLDTGAFVSCLGR